MVEAQLSLLLNVGLLTRHSAAQDRYLFAMPNAGPLVRSIMAGRKVRVLYCASSQAQCAPYMQVEEESTHPEPCNLTSVRGS